MSDTVSEELDKIYDALIDHINQQYDNMPTNLIRTDDDTPDYSERGKGKPSSGSSQPRDVRWWRK